MAKTKKERTVKTMELIKNKCKDCGTEYDANKIEYSNGDIVITPPRCKECQTVHLTNIRVGNALKSLHLIGNLKSRLSAEQREAVIGVITTKLNTVYEQFNGVAVSSTAFDLKTI